MRARRSSCHARSRKSDDTEECGQQHVRVRPLARRSKMASSNTEAGSLPNFSNDLANAVERAGAGVVAIIARERIPSSGVLWRDSVVVTAAHTIKRDGDITVMLPDGRTVPATPVGRDMGTDLAVLKLEAAGAGPADIAETSELRAGHIVLAVGRVSERGVSASLGIVSAAGGEWRTWRG